jgi:gluconate 5-dehydrogenase
MTPARGAGRFALDGRLALVTGSSMGIGFALARGLGQAGARWY